MIFRWILQGCSRTTSSGRRGVAARRSGEAARVTGTAGRTPRAHARAPSSSCILLLTLRASEHLLLPVPPGIHRPLAAAHGQRRRCDMPWGDAAGVCHGSREQDPAGPSALRHLLEGTLAREQLLPRPPGHASPQSGLDRVQGGQCDNVRAASCSEDLWTAGPTRDRGGPGELPPPPEGRGIPPEFPRSDEVRTQHVQHLWRLSSGATCENMRVQRDNTQARAGPECQMVCVPMCGCLAVQWCVILNWTDTRP